MPLGRWLPPLLAMALAGCASTTIRSGLPPGDSPPGYAERWHAAFLFGAVEPSGPYDLDAICPEGWAEVTTEPDAFTIAAGAVTLFLYAPTRVTIVCAARSPGLAFHTSSDDAPPAKTSRPGR